ncbi:MAG TPA: class I SAM-dependent rRNA methyltransferase [Rhabdochlamydiaceae bacterium]|jgi:23S rRNA (cytosine1962-C5)-methyltransferase|nr:class I SAM-dependent rRNA methyltransferase [Rhabdochlamydiaceae bacterium]
MSRVVLKEGKEKSLLNQHPWIFSGAISSRPKHAPGDILPVYSSEGKLLGSGYFHPENSIAGRMINFSAENPLETIRHKLKFALDLRTSLVQTEARRLVNAEGDGLPGLIIDQYADVLVMQIHTAGMEKLKNFLVDELIKLLQPKAIYQKCTAAARRQEGLEDAKGLLYGTETPEVTITEHGISYIVSIVEGQKTGFFLDQREMRKKILELSHNKKVLNCFAYTGGFSLAALKGGASLVHSVEISEEACKLAERNNFDPSRHCIFQADAFDFLRTKPLNYDIVILDPPSFAKKRADIVMASKGYREINRTALQKMPPGSLLLTCSCSSYIDSNLFQQLIFQASSDTGRTVRILGRHIQAPDHPISIYHPEGTYLKSLLLYID